MELEKQQQQQQKQLPTTVKENGNGALAPSPNEGLRIPYTYHKNPCTYTDILKVPEKQFSARYLFQNKS